MVSSTRPSARAASAMAVRELVAAALHEHAGAEPGGQRPLVLPEDGDVGRPTTGRRPPDLDLQRRARHGAFAQERRDGRVALPHEASPAGAVSGWRRADHGWLEVVSGRLVAPPLQLHPTSAPPISP